MPTYPLSRMIATRLRTIAWHVKNDSTKSDPRQRNVWEIAQLCKEFMPSGSGFDAGTTLDIDASTPSKLVFKTAYHHMNEGGYYDGWTEHRVSILATHDGFDITVGGRDRNQIKDYVADCFDNALKQTIHEEWDNVGKEFSFALQR